MGRAGNMFKGIKLRAKKTPPMSFGQKTTLRALQNQKFKYSLPYWSTVRFAFTRTGAGPGPYTYTLANQEVVAFSYGVNDAAPAQAGFGGSGLTMSYTETNLQSRNETLAGEELLIRGIGIQPCADADADATRYVWRSTCAILTLNGGQNRVPIGPLSLVPGGGGLTGGGTNVLGMQPLPGGRPTVMHQSNGFPNRNNILSLPEGIVWKRKSERDGQLGVILQPAPSRTMSFSTPADEAAAAGVRGYSYPATLNVDVLVWLDGTVIGRRSNMM